MNGVVYDGSFEGLMTAVFEIYEFKIDSPLIMQDVNASNLLFGKIYQVSTSRDKSMRVYKKLQERISANSLQQLYKSFLSEIPAVENCIYRYIRYALSSAKPMDNDFSNADVLQIQQLSRKVEREKHRMEAFVRFQLTKDDLYYAVIQPDYNVLPLVSKHFEERYADQRWLIYDIRRKYGIYYDMTSVNEVSLDFSVDLNNNSQVVCLYNENENLYQQLWQQYFSSVNIAARKNTKLHIQHMPKRYWKYLIEKQAMQMKDFHS
jgi:probable DNA metabolism protein